VLRADLAIRTGEHVGVALAPGSAIGDRRTYARQAMRVKSTR
jgi:hypothetical protein